jgi:hypothetical protein
MGRCSQCPLAALPISARSPADCRVEISSSCSCRSSFALCGLLAKSLALLALKFAVADALVGPASQARAPGRTRAAFGTPVTSAAATSSNRTDLPPWPSGVSWRPERPQTSTLRRPAQLCLTMPIQFLGHVLSSQNDLVRIDPSERKLQEPPRASS